ncbi:MAG: PCI domain-containing protein [Anaerofustis sp.]
MNKLDINRKKIKSGRIAAYIALPIGIAAIMLFCGVFVAGLLSTDQYDLSTIMALLFVALIIAAGILLTKFGFEMLLMIHNISYYQSYAKPNEEVTFLYYARLLNLREKKIERELTRLLKRHYLNGYISEDSHSVVLLGSRLDDPAHSDLPEDSVCPNCGARNHAMSSKHAVCDYCGSRIPIKK